ncbi:MAG: phospho-sugar mutase, partial [Candidatus Didemnitutus sp.]|nr:phospho-sugar mutase [Candidatus Didemnitutus sp.]
MTPLPEKLSAAAQAGHLLPSTVENFTAWWQASLPEWAQLSMAELVEREAWAELNDRFYRYMEFGTGGLRGRTIGAVGAQAETGTLSASGSPEHAGVGSNLLNDFTLTRAMIGLFRYVKGYLDQTGNATPPRIVIAHDVRHFSRHFCELAASTWTKLGGEAHIFDGPRSTPQLSFSVRWLKAHCGAVITASHNPPHDNGFKAYFDDGAQVTPPHDTGIIAQVNAVPLSAVHEFLEVDTARLKTLGADADVAYLDVAAQAVIDGDLLRKSPLRAVYTNIHGVGGVSTMPLFKRFGVSVAQVPEQAAFDPRFPTVKSANPENAEALALAVALAEKEGHDVVMATDPDSDRVG